MNKLVLSLLVVLVVCFVAARAASAMERPNIVFVLSDDHSYPHLGCYGDPVKTPNLDRFAEQGLRFDRAFTTAPQCVQSRASLMTGRSPITAGMARFSAPLPPGVPTLPGQLSKAGYYTGVCRRPYHLDGSKRINYAEWLGPDRVGAFRKQLDFVDNGSPRSNTKPVVNKFLDAVPEGRPFFFWINFNDPHHVWDKTGANKPDAIAVPGYLPDLPSVRSDLARYFDEVSRLDEEFGWIVEILEQRGLSENTIVIFMGDNGLAFPHGKGYLHDPGLHVPLLIRWPGWIKPGRTTSELISGEDLMPTLLEVAGAPKPAGMQGRSFAKLLKGEPYQGRKYIHGFRGTHGGAPWCTYHENIAANALDHARCVRSDRFKLIYNCSPQHKVQPVDSGGQAYWRHMTKLAASGDLDEKFVMAYFTHPRPVWELYDLEADPDELDNLADDPKYKEIKGELRVAMAKRMARVGDFLPLPATGK